MHDDRLIYMLAMAHLAVRTHIGSEFLKEGIKVTLPQATVLFLLQASTSRRRVGARRKKRPTPSVG